MGEVTNGSGCITSFWGKASEIYPGARKTNVLTVWEALLKLGGSCGKLTDVRLTKVQYLSVNYPVCVLAWPSK